MSSPELASFACKYCGRVFDDGRKLGGHVRQSHPRLTNSSPLVATPTEIRPSIDDEMAVRILESWRAGMEPLELVTTLRVHPRVVKEVLKEYDELLNEWKRFKEA